MLRAPLALLVLLGTTACHVEDAPENLEELVVFGFIHFSDSRADEAPTGLLPLTEQYADELVEGMRVTAMSSEHLEEAGIEAEQVNPIIGMSATVSMRSSVDEFAMAWSYPNMNEVVEGTLDFRVDTEYGDRECFLAGECDTYGYDGWRHNDLGFFGTSAQDFTREFIWIDVVDGPRVLVSRDIVPTDAEMTGGLFRVHQQYTYSLVFPADGGGTTRLDTFWVDAELIGVDVPDYFALETTVNNLQNTADDVDAFVDAQ